MLDLDFFKYEDKIELLAIKEIRELKKNNKKYNEIMWFIYFVYDYYSYYAEMSFDDRISIIEKDLLEREGWYEEHKEMLKPLIDAYMKTQENSQRKYLVSVLTLMDKRRVFMDSVSYDLDNSKKLDEMVMNTSKLLEQEKEIKKKLADKGDKKIKGDQTLSLLEIGQIKNLDK